MDDHENILEIFKEIVFDKLDDLDVDVCPIVETLIEEATREALMYAELEHLIYQGGASGGDG